MRCAFENSGRAAAVEARVVHHGRDVNNHADRDHLRNENGIIARRRYYHISLVECSAGVVFTAGHYWKRSITDGALSASHNRETCGPAFFTLIGFEKL